MAFSVPISTVQRKENHYSKREVDELDEQKVNFKSQPNKEKSYLWILPVISDFIICDLAFFVRLAFNTMSLSGGSPLYETRFLHGNDEPLHILSAAFYPPYELC